MMCICYLYCFTIKNHSRLCYKYHLIVSSIPGAPETPGHVTKTTSINDSTKLKQNVDITKSATLHLLHALLYQQKHH